MSGRPNQDDVVPYLRQGLREADDAIEVPPGLHERIRATAPPPRRRVAWTTPSSPRGRTLVAAAAVTAIVLASFTLGSWWGRSRATQPASERGGPALLTVFNAEAACQPLRTMECALGVVDDPRKPYADATLVARVWHGDEVDADCVFTGGRLVTDEAGVRSKRWYHVVVLQDGVTGWLPGVRTRNTEEIPECDPAILP